MSKQMYCVLTIGAVLLAVCAATDVRGELLFSDNFNLGTAFTPDAANDYCLNTGLNIRLDGKYKNLASALKRDHLTTSADRVQVNNATWGADMLSFYTAAAGEQYHAAIIRHDFTDAHIGDYGGFTFRFDFDPVSVGSKSSGIAKGYGGGIWIGGSDEDANGYAAGKWCPGRYDTSADLALYIQDDGKLEVYKAGNGGSPVYGYDKVFDANPSGADFVKMYSFELRVSTTGFASATAASAELWWLDNAGNWSQIDLDANSANGITNVSWNWDSNETNYIGFYSTSDPPGYGHFDNVSVFDNYVVPEPNALALLATGLIGLVAYAWRKRK